MNHSQRSLPGLFVIILLAAALLATTLLGPYVTHPGMHALLGACLLNITLWKVTKRSILSIVVLLTTLLLIDIAGVWAIAFSKFDSVEDWYATMCIIATLIVTILPKSFKEAMKLEHLQRDRPT